MSKRADSYTVVKRSDGSFEALGRNVSYETKEGEWMIAMHESKGHRFKSKEAALKAAKERYKSAKRYKVI